MALYVIGDVQGCYDELRDLLDLIRFAPATDRLWFVGDLVNRGPRSLEVLRLVRSLGASATFVHGNHDLHLLSLDAGHGKPRADDALDQVLAAPDRDELMHWLRAQPLMHVEDQFALVHAGLLPQWDVAGARERASEVEAAMRSPDYRAFFATMYGSEPASWSDSLAGAARLRVIVNAMTRMRFCTPQGTMEFHHKGGVVDAPVGYLPWFDVPGRRSASHTILCGHWSTLGLLRRDDLVALDTGCVWGGALTAIRLGDSALFQVRSRQPRRPGAD